MGGLAAHFSVPHFSVTLGRSIMSRRRNQRTVKPESSTPVVVSTPATVHSSPQPMQRLERALLIVIVIAGAGLRLYALSHSAVEHFDEGVYASNVYFGGPDYAYPQQRLYAPPLLPALIEAGMIVGLPPNVAALLPSFLAGCGTIVALWWFGRSWFSPAVGLGAAVLAALSDFHIAYSATALTDVLLGLWLVLAVDAMARSLLKGDYRWAIGAGIYTGLAWWTKYNGWLPLAIEAAALPLLWLITQQHFLRRLSCFAATAVTATLIWTPYYFSLQSQGGYGPIAANHAKYVVGFTGWLDSAGRQISAQHVTGVLLSATALGLALTVAGYVRSTSVRAWLGTAGSAALGGTICGYLFTSFVIAGFAAAVGICASLIVLFRAGKLDALQTRQPVAACLVAAWWVGLLVATPCYWPYPRLVLPWLLATWLGTALCWQTVLTSAERDWRPKRVSQWLGLLILTAWMISMCLIGSQLPASPEVYPGKDRCSYQKIAAEIQSRLPSTLSRAIYIYGEPALFFQLKAAGEPFVGPVQDIPAEAVTAEGLEMPMYLVVGPHARRDPQFQSEWPAARSRWELVTSFEYQPSAIVWLDLFDPRKVDPREQPKEMVEVFRWLGVEEG